MAGILGTSLSGLMAAQQSLDTISHNIANVNTDGYSRQRVELGTNAAKFTGSGYIGQGVNITTVARSYDQFINNQLTSSTSAFAEADTLSTMAAQVDGILSGESTSVSPALKAFFNAVNEVANDPTSQSVRQVMVTEASSLAQQFNTMSTQLEGLRDQNNNQMGATLDSINSYARTIADLNAKIVLGSNRSSGQLPNDLLDQRDELVAKIAEKVSVSTLQQKDGSLSVFIGSGQSLVLGSKAATLSLAGSSADFSHKNILMDGQDITPQITGGELSGALQFRDDILDPAQQQMGLLAAGFAVQFNAAHQAGFDLNAQAGKAFFDAGAPAVISAANNTGNVTASYDASTIGQLTASDYQLSYDGSNFSLKRLSDNADSSFPGPPPTTIAGPGFTIATGATVAANDSFLIRPTFNAAHNITSVITDPAEIAASGSAASVPGDNTAALNLASLENQAVLLGGNATFNEINGQLVSKIGTLTSAAKVSSSAQEALLNQATQSRENLSGVNLDEEAANLIKFQQSYQAAAQAVSVASSIFDTLIGAIR
ncbi:MAG: flagellar hook-associated protein FlgK [Methylovulum sp.]|nr:flagellar hook-associated protein FlgK [Methylovulum sp.]